ncbi:MAG: FAD-binding protein [Gammaproteobacteria bacterium]|nr:FAD-binding protein [Gammaproteobacteria bacterium]
METKQCDLLLIGSGAAAMTAALTALTAGLSVLMVEKEEYFGGASARSGGCIWMPNLPRAAAAGGKDSREMALQFFMHENGPRFNARLATAFIDNGPRMVEFVEQNSPLRFHWLGGFPDYHCDSPGGSTTGRAYYPAIWDAGPLGKEIHRLRPQLGFGTFLGMQIGVNEVGYFMTAGRKLGSLLYVAKCILLRIRDQFRAGRTLRLAAGNALLGALASSAFERGLELWTTSPARELIREGERIVGAVVDTARGRVRIEARRGVVLGTGGFPHDSKRRAELFPPGATAPEVWGMMPYGNSGDGIRLGESVGAKFNADMKSPIALTPINTLHSGEGRLETMPIFFNRGMPGVIMVTRDGRRFANEGRSYHDVGVALLRQAAGEPEAVAWVICDHRVIRRYGMGRSYPFPLPYRRHVKSGYLRTGRTIRELAVSAGINPDGLEQTVANYNRNAAEGRDPEFNRGTNAFDIASGDPEHKPNPAVGPLDHAPFYAIRVYAGCVGTFAGLQTDENAQVLDTSGRPIAGLYAVGNDMASVTGGDYISGGCTLGPGMTFGYVAARHAAGLSAQQASPQSAQVT